MIRIPSVSAKPENIPDVRRAAKWVAARVTAAGMENARVMPTAGHPVVYADWLHAGEDRPTVMIYGHFDVQPRRGARHARAERRCRAVASVVRLSTLATPENGGFIRMTLGHKPASR